MSRYFKGAYMDYLISLLLLTNLVSVLYFNNEINVMQSKYKEKIAKIRKKDLL